MVICGDNVGNKLIKAQDLGVDIILEEELKELL